MGIGKLPYVILVTILSSVVFASAQSERTLINQLKVKLELSRTDTNRVRILLLLADMYLTSSANGSQAYMDTALLHVKNAEGLSRSLGFKYLIADCLIEKSKMFLDFRAPGEPKNRRNQAIISLAEALKILNLSTNKLRWADATFLLADATYADSIALQYFKSALKVYREKNLPDRTAKTLVKIATLERFNNRYAEALHTSLEAWVIQKSIHDKEIGKTLYLISILYGYLGNYPKALQWAQHYHRVALNSDNLEDLRRSYFGLAIIYSDMGDKKTALQFANSQLQIDIKRKDRVDIVQTRLKIATLLCDLNRNQEALVQAKLILRSAENNVKSFIRPALIMVASCHLALKAYPKAELYYSKIFLNYKKINGSWESDIYLGLGVVYAKTNRLARATRYLNQALKIARQNKSPEFQRKILLQLYQLDSSRNDFKSALAHYKLYTTLKDTLLNESKNKQIASLQVQFDTENKVKDIRLLKQQSNFQQSQLREASV